MGAQGQKLFDRIATLRIFNLENNQVFRIDGLRISFDLEKSKSDKANDGEIRIYNLSDSGRTFVEIPQGSDDEPRNDKLFIELSAGYKGMTRVIFTGNATATNEYQAPDWITSLKVTDGGVKMRKAYFSKSYKAGTKIQSIINDLANSFGFAIGYIKPDITTDVLRSGFAASGLSRDILNDYARTYNFQWWINNGAISLIDADAKLPETQIVVSPETGLLGRPVKKDDGIEFKTLLLPQIIPGSTVRIRGSSVFEGQTKVERVQYKGDNRSGDFNCMIQASIL